MENLFESLTQAESYDFCNWRVEIDQTAKGFLKKSFAGLHFTGDEDAPPVDVYEKRWVKGAHTVCVYAVLQNTEERTWKKVFSVTVEADTTQEASEVFDEKYSEISKQAYYR